MKLYGMGLQHRGGIATCDGLVVTDERGELGGSSSVTIATHA